MIDQQSIEQVKNAAVTFDVINSIYPLKRQGAEWVTTCPFHNEKSPSFKVSKTKNMYKCFGCGESGDSISFLMKTQNIVFLEAIKWLANFYNIHLNEERKEIAKTYVKPLLKTGGISDKWLSYFSNRGISPATLSDLKVTMTSEWMPKAGGLVDTMCFNYFRDGELINVKYRADNKDFKLSKDAELIFYNLDSIKDKEIVIIVEGEIDCLSVYQCVNKANVAVLSVPNGANAGNQKLEYLDNCYSYFHLVKTIVLMTDNDSPGISLRDELARRFGFDKCLKVTYPPDCKDANDILIKHGKEKLLLTISEAIEFPIEGVFSVSELYDDVKRFYQEGYPSGIKVGIPGFDDLISLMRGQFTTVSGIPGSGKSEFIDYIITEASRNHDWIFGICSFENQPSSLHVTKLMEKYVGKSFARRYDDNDRISVNEFDSSISFINEHFYFININKIDVTLDGILDKAKELILRKGMSGLVIDPWNYIEHKNGRLSETEYVSICLTKIKSFCAIHQVHIFLIAHPTKMPKVNGNYEVPTMYSISGSAHFFNKSDNGIVVSRNYVNNTVEVYVQKVRYSWLGKLGSVSFTYNTDRRIYEPINTPTSAVNPYSVSPVKSDNQPF